MLQTHSLGNRGAFWAILTLIHLRPTILMLVKTLIVLVLLAILFSLFSGMIFLVKDKGQSERTVRALTIRIALSVLLFILLMVAFATGLIHPHGIVPG